MYYKMIHGPYNVKLTTQCLHFQSSGISSVEDLYRSDRRLIDHRFKKYGEILQIRQRRQKELQFYRSPAG